MSNLDAALVWLDSGVCSQVAGHSFWLDGRPLPLCAPDLGLFGGFLLGLPFARAASLRWLLGLLPLVLDGANSLAYDALQASLYAPSNAVRLTTGLLAGACLAIVMGERSHDPLRRRVALPARWGMPAGRPSVCRSRLAPAMAAVGAVAAAIVLAVGDGWLLPAAIGTAGMLALAAAANRLAMPGVDRHLAWALALPEVALLAGAKAGLLAILR